MGPQSWSFVRHFQKFHFTAATVPTCVVPEVQKQFYFVPGRLSSGCSLKFGVKGTAKPYPSASRGPGAPPQKCFPQFLKILRGQGQNVECAIRGPLRGVCGEIFVTVPWPISQQKIPKFSRKSSISRVTRISEHVKKLRACALDLV